MVQITEVEDEPLVEATTVGCVPGGIALRTAWHPEVGQWEAFSITADAAPGTPDFAALVGSLGSSSSNSGATEDLCVALRNGGHAAAELACEHGAVEAAAKLLGGQAKNAGVAQLRAVEALWFLIDDYDSCQSLIRCGGQSQVLKLACEKGSQDATFACSAFRLLTQTLYGESRNSGLWSSSDADFIVEALMWALKAGPSEAHVADPICSLLCDIAALWVQRFKGAEAAKALVGIIPLLLAKMSDRRDDFVLLQHGCRLLHALAKKSDHWPEDLRVPTMVAMSQLEDVLRMSPDPQVMACAQVAMQAVATLPETPKEVFLSTMD